MRSQYMEHKNGDNEIHYLTRNGFSFGIGTNFQKFDKNGQYSSFYDIKEQGQNSKFL